MTEFPPVRELVPHGGAMVLLDRVLAHDENATTCAIEIPKQELFRDADGAVPAWIGIEYMAQCIAVHAGLVRRSEGEREPQSGFLVGGRGLEFHVDRFAAGESLLVTARRRWSGITSLVSFECELRSAGDGTLLAAGRLNCFNRSRAAAESAT